MTDEKKIEEMTVKKYGYGIRHVQMLCMWVCIMALFLARSSLGVAVLAMTDVSRRNDSNVEIYDWDKKTQGLILSSFFWGYMVMQIPVGVLSKKYGGKLIMLVALLVNGIISLILPTVAHYGGWMCVCLCRVCMGLSQACLLPGSHTMLGKWLPPSERTVSATLVYAGNSIGTIIAMPVSGILAETALGWKMIFYSTAGLMFVVAFFWYWFAASSPAEHRMISVEERDYIETELNTGHQINENRPTPWIPIFKTVPLWAITVAHSCGLIVFTLFFLDLPTYLDKALQISLKNSAIFSALPHAGMWIGSVVAASISSKIVSRRLLSLVACRKLFTSFAFLGAATGSIILAFLSPAQKALAVVVIIATLSVLGCVYAGFLLNHLDLSPHFAGVLMSITNFIGAFASLTTPVVTSILLKNDPTNLSNWRVVFLLVAAVLVVANTFYIIFGSTERQPWDIQDDAQGVNKDEMEPLKTTKAQEALSH